MWSRLEDLLETTIAAEVFAGCSLCVRSSHEELVQLHKGSAELRPRQRPVRPHLSWDLASLTKVLVTTPLAMALVGAGKLDLDQPISEILPGAPPGPTFAHCLHHVSGLAAWRPLFRTIIAEGRPWGTPQTRERMLQLVYEVPPEAPPGTRYRYSDLGFLMLGAALETVGGDRIDRLWEHWVRRPAGADLRWGWPGAAATEDCPQRGRVVVGSVHDLNAAVMGGLAPHAGLFGAADQVAAAVAWQLRAFQGDSSAGLQPGVVRSFWTAESVGSHRLGWDRVSSQGSSAGPRWPLDGVGHLGFTGCSIWVAPRQDIIVVFLSNRVHPEIEGGAVPDAPLSARYQAFRSFRPSLHTHIVQTLEDAGRWAD